jgi:cell division protein FtsL
MTRPARVAPAGPARAGSRTAATRTGTARTGTARTGTGRTGTAAARTGTATGRVSTTTGPVRTAPSAPRRTGPVPSRPQLRLVPPAVTPTRVRRTVTAGRRAPFVLLVVLMLVGTTVSLLLLNTAIAVDSLEANQRRAAIADQAQEVDRLEQQVVTGSTAAQLARTAADAGLVPSGAAAHLVLGADGTSAVRGEAVPAEPPTVAPAAPGAPAAPPAAPPAQTSGD